MPGLRRGRRLLLLLLARVQRLRQLRKAAGIPSPGLDGGFLFLFSAP